MPGERPIQLRMDVVTSGGKAALVPEPPELATKPKATPVAPQERVYGGLTRRERWDLEHEGPEDGIYRGGN